MTTPAQNVNVKLLGHSDSYRMFPGDGGWVHTGTLSSPRSHERLVRPKSHSVPRREDGTRPPYPYGRYGGISLMPMAEHDWSEDQQNRYRHRYVPYQNVNLLPDVPGVLTFSPEVYNRALTKYLANLKGSKVNLGVALGEARETARMVSKSARRIASTVRAFRRGNPRKVWRSIVRKENIPETWLEIQYGWNPLLRDVLGSAEALAEAQNQGRRFNLVVKGFASERSPYSLTRSQPAAFGVEYTGEDKQHCEIVGNYDLPASILPSLSSLGLTNPLEIVWELVPYSFVVDWMFPVGTWLSGLDAGWGLSFREGSVSRIRRITARGHPIVDPNQGWWYNRSVKEIRPGLLRWYTFNRGLLSGTPWPVLPRLRSPLGLGKMANALSLLATAFSRRG